MPEATRVTVRKAAPRSIACISSFKDHDALAAAMRAEFGTAIPDKPGWVQAGDVALSCLAPARYLATAHRNAALPARLARSLAGLAAVTDQSDMWATFVASGPDIREVLARVVPIDLDPARFPAGSLACTRAGHIDVRLWHVAEQAYEIAATASVATDLRYVLEGTQEVLL